MALVGVKAKRRVPDIFFNGAQANDYKAILIKVTANAYPSYCF